VNALATSSDSASAPALAFREAVAVVGSQPKTAALLKVSQEAISKRIRKKQPAAAEWVLTLERESGVSRHALRPDIYPLDESGSHPLPSDVRSVPLIGRVGACERPPKLQGPARSGTQLGEPVR
jgi:DNA-binding transcriptional regulator YdaS (Cro superfamily)